jgi:hypothetical protein
VPLAAGVPESLRQHGKGYAARFWGPLRWPVFSRLREIWLGRVAMVGFLAACVGEVRAPGLPCWLASWPGLAPPATRQARDALALGAAEPTAPLPLCRSQRTRA